MGKVLSSAWISENPNCVERNYERRPFHLKRRPRYYSLNKAKLEKEGQNGHFVTSCNQEAIWKKVLTNRGWNGLSDQRPKLTFISFPGAKIMQGTGLVILRIYLAFLQQASHFLNFNDVLVWLFRQNEFSATLL